MYGRLKRPGGMGITARMLEAAGFTSGARLLDVCCGEGSTVEMLLEADFDAWGVDIEPGASGVRLMRGSAYELPCEDGSIHGILCECALSLLEPGKALGEFSRALKTGGALLLSDVYARGEAGRIGTLRAYTRANLDALLARHGFTVQLFEDRTDALKSFIAQRIMDGGDWPCGEFVTDGDEKHRIRCGYYFLVAWKL